MTGVDLSIIAIYNKSSMALRVLVKPKLPKRLRNPIAPVNWRLSGPQVGSPNRGRCAIMTSTSPTNPKLF